MVDVRQLYGRLDQWTRNLSRVQYAAFAGITSFVSYLGIGALLGGLPILGAVAMGLTFGAIYYVMRPRQFNGS